MYKRIALVVLITAALPISAVETKTLQTSQVPQRYWKNIKAFVDMTAQACSPNLYGEAIGYSDEDPLKKVEDCIFDFIRQPKTMCKLGLKTVWEMGSWWKNEDSQD